MPVMQLEIRNAVERDRIVYNALGFLGGCLIAILFFRRISFMIIAAAPPLLAILLALGMLGWLGFRLNIFLNVMTPLIMVISFSDSMQLTYATRDRILAGQSKADALRMAIHVVGPACVLTHATAGLSFVALTFSNSDLIRSFGEAGIIATLIALVSVLTLIPLLGMFLIRREAAFAKNVKGADMAVDALRRFCGWIAARMVTRPGLYSLCGLIVVIGLGFIYADLQPRYHLADQVPDKEKAVQANRALDAKLTGAQPVDVLVEFPKGQSLYSPETLANNCRGPFDRREAGGLRQCVVARDIAAVAGAKGGQVGRQHPAPICELSAEISRRTIRLERPKRRGRRRPAPGYRLKQIVADRRCAR